MNMDKKALNTNFILLLLGRMVSDTGTGIQAVIMPLYIIDAGGSAATVGLFSFLSLVPALLVYPFAGVLGDRLNRKKIMVATDIANGLIILSLALIAYAEAMNLTLLLLVQVLVSILYGFFDPATKGMLPSLVAKEELAKANSTIASTRILTGLLSPIVGVALYAGFGIKGVFFINGASFLLSGLSEMLIRYKHARRETRAAEPGLAADLSEGMRFILVSKTIRKLCVFFLIIYALIQPIFTVVLPLFFRTRLQYSDTQYGYLQIAMMLGALLGSILVGLASGKGQLVSRSLTTGCIMLIGTMLGLSALFFPYSVAVLGNGTILYFALLAAVLCLLSMAIMFINVPVQTYLQKATPNEYMSRMFSIVGMITKGGMPFGALLYGIILDRLEVHWTINAAVFLMVVISIRFLVSIQKNSELDS